MDEQTVLKLEPSSKRIRAIVGGKTIADSLRTILVLEAKHAPVYYFPREDVWMEHLERSLHHTHCPLKGEASYWHLRSGTRTIENALWSYEAPIEQAADIRGHLAFYWGKVDHWLEEDEEIFGHPRDPYHRVDVVPSSRHVRAVIGGESIASTRRGLFVFETGFPTRYYIPADDVRMDLMTPSATRSICPYKGQASYVSARVGDHVVRDVAWVYRDPLPECPRIRGYLCFYPEKLDRLDVEGEPLTDMRA